VPITDSSPSPSRSAPPLVATPPRQLCPTSHRPPSASVLARGSPCGHRVERHPATHRASGSPRRSMRAVTHRFWPAPLKRNTYNRTARNDGCSDTPTIDRHHPERMAGAVVVRPPDLSGRSTTRWSRQCHGVECDSESVRDLNRVGHLVQPCAIPAGFAEPPPTGHARPAASRDLCTHQVVGCSCGTANHSTSSAAAALTTGRIVRKLSSPRRPDVAAVAPAFGRVPGRAPGPLVAGPAVVLERQYSA